MTNYWRVSYLKNEGFKIPKDESRVWRYMSFSNFEEIVETSTLFFAHSKLFENDDLEDGNLPKDVQTALNEMREERSKTYREPTSDKFEEILRNTTFVNSWTLNEDQNEMLWLKDGGKDIAIQSTFGRFRDSFGKYNKSGIVLYLGLVEYSIKANQGLTSYSLGHFMQKDVKFADEKELRALVYFESQFKTPTKGVHIRVDLATLIENVFISASANKEMQIITNYLLHKHRLGKALLSKV